MFASEVDAEAAAVFTRNHFPGAPVIVGREIIKAGRLRAVVVNSKVSNVATGQAGVQNVRRMAAWAWHAICAFAGRLKKWGKLMTCGRFRLRR